MPVEIRIFDPPESTIPTFRTAGRATAATSVTLVERLYTPGYFTVTIPWEARHAEQLKIGRLALIDGVFWGVIDDLSLSVESAGQLLTVSGRQLKGLTSDRITIPPGFTAVTGAQGYDAQTGTTEEIMKHFVSANLGPEAPANRAVYGLELAPDLGRGVAGDKYMSRHEVLSDVLAALGEAAELGYDIVPDLSRHKLVFDVVEGLDHTAGQSGRKRVIFEIERRTVLSQAYQRNTSDSRNLFYTTMAGSEFADETLTVTYIRDGEEEPAGIHRREKHLDISADTPVAGDEYNELKRLALIEAEGFKAAESFTCEIAEGPYVYRQDYGVGDLVTVQNKAWGVTMDARLTEMQTGYSSSGVKHTATFGTAPLNVFGRLKRQIAKGE